jgi:hypothetical protein
MLLRPCFKVGKSIRRTIDPRSDATDIRWKIHFNSATHTPEAINLPAPGVSSQGNHNELRTLVGNSSGAFV